MYGLTLMEVTIVVAVVAMLIVAISPFIRTSYQTWDVGERKTEIIQNARLGIDRLMTDLRQAKRLVNGVQEDGFQFDTGANEISFKMDVTVDSTAEEHLRKYYYQPDAPGSSFGWLRVTESIDGGTPTDEILVGPMLDPPGAEKALSFIYWDKDGDSVSDIGKVKSVDVTMRFSDEDGSLPFEITYRVFCRKGNPSVNHPLPLVINEVMYRPSQQQMQDVGANRYQLEWVELYNSGDDSIDMGDWEISDRGGGNTIIGDSDHGTGSTNIPSQKFAIITTNDTKVYDDKSPFNVPGDAIKLTLGGKKGDKIGKDGLGNNDDDVILLTPDEEVQIIDMVSYDQGDGWPVCVGESLEKKDDSLAESNESDNWERSDLEGTHTPGDDNTLQ